jgi:hypothetical protein
MRISKKKKSSNSTSTSPNFKTDTTHSTRYKITLDLYLIAATILLISTYLEAKESLFNPAIPSQVIFCGRTNMSTGRLDGYVWLFSIFFC